MYPISDLSFSGSLFEKEHVYNTPYINYLLLPEANQHYMKDLDKGFIFLGRFFN